MKTLGSIVTYKKGKPPKTSPHGRLPVLSPHYLRTGQIEDMAEPTSKDVVLKGGELILLWDGSNAGEFFRARAGVLSSTMVAFNFDEEETNPNYLYYDLKRFEPELKGRTAGSGIPHVDKEVLLARRVFDGGPDEQKAAAKVLLKVDRAIDQTEALLAKQRRIKTGLMHDLLTRGLDAQGQVRDVTRHAFKRSEIGLVPSDWEVVSIESLVPANSPICYGIVQVGPHTPGGVPTIAIRDLDDIQVLNLHYTEPEREKRFTRSRCHAGDLLISIKATTGRFGVAPAGFNGNISRDLARVRLASSEIPHFFKYQLQSAAGQSRLDAITVGTTRKELSIIPLRGLLVARPKPSEQEAIALKIQKLEADLAGLKGLISKFKLLKNGLMRDLLTGRVPVTPLLANPEAPTPS